MDLRNLALKGLGWFKTESGDNSSILSTRLRLARNLDSTPFPWQASEEQLKEVLNEIFRVSEESSLFENSKKIKLADCSKIDRRLLVKRHLISREQAGTSKYGGVVIDEQEQLSVMINEEDHLRIQFIEGGLNFFRIWDIINKIDDNLGESLEMAYSNKWGYLPIFRKLKIKN